MICTPPVWWPKRVNHNTTAWCTLLSDMKTKQIHKPKSKQGEQIGLWCEQKREQYTK